MRALVVGHGSIGARHARVLASLGCEVAIVSARAIDAPLVFPSLSAALAWQPGYVVVANATSRHRDALAELAARGFAGAVLVEKPLFDEAAPLPPHAFAGAWVGYNLRLHPLVARVRALLERDTILSVEAYVGQHLPAWRPGTDYRSSYSARRAEGGGVLRDLSHELDLLTWLLGPWDRLAALGGHLSRLEIDSDDVWTILMSTRRCPAVSLQLNYLDRLGRRRLLFNTGDHTIEADLVNGRLTIDGAVESIATDRDLTYAAQHRAVLAGRTDGLCTLEEGMEVLRMIAAVERAAREKAWVAR